MQTKPLYVYAQEQLDFADEITWLIREGDSDNGSYFMTLIYIEDILDKYGRSLASHAAIDAGLAEDQVKDIRVSLNARLEALRKTIRSLTQAYDFDEVIAQRGQDMLKYWAKRSS